jgi:hypothetical protein
MNRDPTTSNTGNGGSYYRPDKRTMSMTTSPEAEVKMIDSNAKLYAGCPSELVELTVKSFYSNMISSFQEFLHMLFAARAFDISAKYCRQNNRGR